MPIIKDKYEQQKIDRLKHYLQTNSERGNAKLYEIFVDSLKAVLKTDDPAEFESYEEYVNADTQRIRILIYNSPNSPRNDQYIFELKENKETAGLNGVEIENRISEKIDSERKKWETDQVKKDNEDLKEKLREAEEYIETLEDGIEQLKSKKFKLGDIHVGELASVMLEGIIRRNPKMLSKLPGGDALAGVIEQDNKEREQEAKIPAIETEATFKKKEAHSPPLTNEEQEYLRLLKQLEGHFDEAQLKSVMQILQKLSENPSIIPTVEELLNEPLNNQ